MENFLSKVLRAVDELGEAPYDYKKTEENLLKATRKTLEYYEKLKESRKENDT
ncbi:hypothetical protein [Desulfosporosinus hippei]|uniref:Uncharacterized protein n=1 Tax=Desulfosporosinus hippei DSM 8344 TaxID=1121419 RepID=A0A1G8LQN3_9FIRM|nr:hypothetical protein [Desulfosporosinus hippei]SDI57520.1 hypothetical protein SAMN05443529_1529 [Desulfosporosinus hippei DSM 8344]